MFFALAGFCCAAGGVFLTDVDDFFLVFLTGVVFVFACFAVDFRLVVLVFVVFDFTAFVLVFFLAGFTAVLDGGVVLRARETLAGVLLVDAFFVVVVFFLVALAGAAFLAVLVDFFAGIAFDMFLVDFFAETFFLAVAFFDFFWVGLRESGACVMTPIKGYLN